MRDLYISYNKLKVINQTLFTSLVKLERLDLNNNEIEYIHPLAFRGFNGSLEKLDLSCNRLKSLRKLLFKRMKSLLVHNNQITTLESFQFGHECKKLLRATRFTIQ